MNNKSSVLPIGEQCWVILFGFPPAQTALVIEEFLSCGQIVSHHSESPLCNYVMVQFETPLGAQRALTRDGTVLERNGLMIGVQRSEAGPKTKVRVAQSSTATSQSLFLQPQRSAYTVSSSHIPYEQAPYGSDSWFSRFKYYILGL
jgi:nuclear pore complex protein Nup53